MGADQRTLEALLGHEFARPELLVRALTHKSRLTPKAGDETGDNERLEFLGDAVLGFLTSEWLLTQYPDLPEGDLSKRKAQLVSATHLHRVAQRLSIGDFLRLGRSEELSGGRDKRALLADALEALIAALYLDGGLEPVRQFVLTHILQGQAGEDTTTREADYKTALQERAQALRLASPQYRVVRETGPEHAKTFLVEVSIAPGLASQAEGSSKKSAGQRAAEQLLTKLQGA